MPCAAIFAPAGILLVVIVGVLPLLLPSSSAVGAVHALARQATTVAGPESPRILQLRHPESSLESHPVGAPEMPFLAVHAAMSSGTAVQSGLAAASLGNLTTSTGIPENAAQALDQFRTPSLSKLALPGSTEGVVVSRRGPSPIGEVRNEPAPRTAPTTGIRNAERQLRLLWPVRGAVTSPFGWRTHPIFGTREFHTGIDIAGQMGAPVVAAYPGTVRFVGWRSGYGQQVIVDHGGGFETAYSHLSAASVQPGTHVEQGQEIGRIGSTGWSTGPHLLFEVFVNGAPRNPAGYLY
jgi:murein DD-endopeptidase MepM/ murein hydrolase activator NlpD